MGTKTLSPELLRDWVASSSFVLQGRLTALGQSNLHGIKPNERMAMVKVDEVVIAPRTLGNIKGKTITVYLQSNDGLTNDQQWTFFATSWHYGNNIGVTEVGRTELSANQIREDTINEYLRQLDEKLKERIKTAKVIVSGSVISTYHSDNDDERRSLIEEEADWHKANIRIDTVEKGDPPDDLHVLFPMSGGKEFLRFPTYNEGQTGVWLLHSSEESNDPQQQKNQVKAKIDKEEEELIAQDPLDYHAISALPRIQTLLWSINPQ